MLFYFLFCSQYFCSCAHFHQFLFWAYSHENTNQSYNLQLYILFEYFILQMNSLLLLALNVLLLKWHSLYCLNLNVALNWWADVALQSIITLITNFSFIKSRLTCFFGSATSSYLYFLWFELYFVVISRKYLCFNLFSICFSFKHNIPSLSIIVSIAFP